MSRIGQAIVNKSRADKFLLVLTLPKVLKDLDAEILTTRAQEFIQLETLQFAVWGTVVPNVSIPAEELKMWGQPYKVTSQARAPYTNVNVNFTIDNNFNNYWVLWKWLEYINTPKKSGMNEYFGDYSTGTESNNVQRAVEKAALVGDDLNGRKNMPISKNVQFQSIKNTKYLDYQTIISIYGLDEYNVKSVKFDYTNTFITDLGEIRYNYRDPGELESSFTFAFSQMEITLLDKNTGGTALG